MLCIMFYVKANIMLSKRETIERAKERAMYGIRHVEILCLCW